MSAETMLHFLNNCTPEEKFGFRVVTQCAPVLKGVKISNLITMKPGGWRKIRAYLKKSRIICIPLYADAEKEVLFLYRYEQLERHLKNREVREFLRSCGYESFDDRRVFHIIIITRIYLHGRRKRNTMGNVLRFPVCFVSIYIQKHQF